MFSRPFAKLEAPLIARLARAFTLRMQLVLIYLQHTNTKRTLLLKTPSRNPSLLKTKFQSQQIFINDCL